MSIVGPTLSAGIAALQALAAPAPANTASAQPTSAHVLTGASRTVLSPAAADAVLGLNAVGTSARATAQVSGTSNARDAYAREAIPIDKVAWLESLGADTWVLRSPTALDDAAFEQQALASMSRSGSSKLPGFAAARENGTLKLQRAADIPELGYRSFQLTLYKDGTEFGGVGFGTLNDDRWMELRQRGTFAVTGSVGGNDYVATWPLAWEDARATAARAA